MSAEAIEAGWRAGLEAMVRRLRMGQRLQQAYRAALADGVQQKDDEGLSDAWLEGYADACAAVAWGAFGYEVGSGKRRASEMRRWEPDYLSWYWLGHQAGVRARRLADAHEGAAQMLRDAAGGLEMWLLEPPRGSGADGQRKKGANG